MILRGKAWLLGDLIDTDLLAPGLHMRKPLSQLSKHCLEAIEPRFAAEVAVGDIVVAGNGFGIGSSREQAAQVLVELGVGAVVARSFARIFYRNAINLGLPVLVCPEIDVAAGSELEIDPVAGRLRCLSSGREFVCEPIPPRLLELLAAGGLMPWLHQRLQK